jgi:hypothetical protein
MKFNPLGTLFREGAVILEVTATKDNAPLCEGCWYASMTGNKKNYSHSCFRHGHLCTSGNRRDRRQVIFKKVII